MQNFIFELPTKVIFGKGNISGTGKELKAFGSKVLMVYGSGSIKKNGIYGQVTSSLKDAGISYIELPGVKSNPVLSLVYKGIEAARKESVDLVLAVGGGSVIDTAKAIAAGVKADHDVWDFFTRTKTIAGALPVAVVLTLAASASEMNPAAVITNDKTNQKYSARSVFLQPKVAIMDPTALFSLGPEYTAYSGVDAITHMLEGYFNNSEPASPLQDRFVESLMKTVMESTQASLARQDDYDARANMMWAATLAFNGLTTAGMGNVSFPAHMLGHPLSALHNIPHGASLSITLPAWMTYFAPRNPGKFGRLAREVLGISDTSDLKAATAGIGMLKQWFATIGAPTSFQACSVPASDIFRIAENAHGLAQVWGLKDYTVEVITEIYELCR